MTSPPSPPNRRRRRIVLGIAVVVLATAIGWRLAVPSVGRVRPDPDVAWRIEFGRGSGWHGLETVKVASDSSVVLHRLSREANDGSWETTNVILPSDVVAEVLASVEEHQLLALSKMYSANVHDGTQWVFLFRQKETVRSVYFDNVFPRAIKRFAGDLDRILGTNGLGAAVWHQVPTADARRHEQELWDGIRR